MKVVILAGGMGTRLSEETTRIPKPMVEIGGKPIIWHIMKIYSYYGYNKFIICLGYKGFLIKEYFYNYYMHNSDISVDLKTNSCVFHKSNSENWKITLVDTGENAGTAGRLKQIENYIDTDDFMMTYGDGVSDININELIKFHKTHNKIVTITAVKPLARFGSLNFNEKNKQVYSIKEKNQEDCNYINGGFFVFKKNIFKELKKYKQETMLEKAPLEDLADKNQLYAYQHDGYWRCVDTLWDKKQLEKDWENNALWKVW